MSFLVTRPLIPVPSSCWMSMLCSEAILRTSGLDLVRRNSSAEAPSPLRAGGPVLPFAAPAVSAFLTKVLTSVLWAAGEAGAGAEVMTGLGRSIVAAGSGFAGSDGAVTSAGAVVGTAAGAGGDDAAAGDAGAAAASSFADSFAGGAAPLPSRTATTVFTSTVSPSLYLTSVSVPAAGEGISASTLSVEISNNGSSRSTCSPTFFSHLVIVPSAMDSPICGITTSVAMMTPVRIIHVFSLSSRWINDRLNLRNPVRRKAALLCVLANHFLVGRDVDAVKFVAGDIALLPLNLRTHLLQNSARCLRRRLELFRRHVTGPGNLSLDYVLRHVRISSIKSLESSYCPTK